MRLARRIDPIVAQQLRREREDGFDEFLKAVGLATETRDVFRVRSPGLSHGLVPWVSITLFLQPIQSQDAQHKAVELGGGP